MPIPDPIESLEDPIDHSERNPQAGRFLGFRIAILLVFVLLAGRLFQLQIIEGYQHREQADNNRFRQVRIDPLRGVLYDRNGILLVRNTSTYAITIIPADLPEKRDSVYQRLGALVNKTPESIAQLVELPPAGKRETDNFTPIPIATNVSQDLAFTIEERHLDIPGVHVDTMSKREYLDGSLTSHIVGYVRQISSEQYTTLKTDTTLRYSMSDQLGQTGLEYIYESQLRGQVGQKTMEVDASGREVRTLEVAPPRPGNNLRLTIDVSLQREIERICLEFLPKYKQIAVVAMDPNNGQVLAMVSLPTYDNNLFSGTISEEAFQKLINDPERPLVNHAISDVNPPGSTFKIITAAAALQEKVVAPSSQFTCNQVMLVSNQFGTSRFVCWTGHGPQDVISGIANSCDIYFYNLGGGSPDGKLAGLGVDRLAKWANLFGLGQKTGIDLPDEAVGNIPTSEWKKETWNEDWYLGDTYNMSIGQGFVSATPIQMLNMLSASVNGGTLYQPQLVKEIADADGNIVRPFTPKIIRKIPVDQGYWDLIGQGLRGNMIPSGTTPWGTKYSGTAWTDEVPGANMGAKTGTAEYGSEPDPVTGMLPTHGWFVTAAPIDNPKIALGVYVENGRGSQEAGDLAKRIMSYYYGAPGTTR